jgi:hypothetical protein
MHFLTSDTSDTVWGSAWIIGIPSSCHEPPPRQHHTSRSGQSAPREGLVQRLWVDLAIPDFLDRRPALGPEGDSLVDWR